MLLQLLETVGVPMLLYDSEGIRTVDLMVSRYFVFISYINRIFRSSNFDRKICFFENIKCVEGQRYA